MRSHFIYALFLPCLISFQSWATAIEQKNHQPNAILVDKKTNTLILADYVGGKLVEKKRMRATLGKVKGDKEREGDLKTPEGIYGFDFLTTPPRLAPKFGVMAFHMNFPNLFDQIAGRSGTNIMLHATNEPDRLAREYDSEGCIVLKNEEISDLKPSIRVKLTPILIFDDLRPEYLNPGDDATLKDVFQGWLKSWETKDISNYSSLYHSDFTAQGMDLPHWTQYKKGLAERYKSIEVVAKNIVMLKHPKYSVIQFEQNYLSHLKNGRIGHKSRGTKMLYVGEENGKFKIISENFGQETW